MQIGFCQSAFDPVARHFEMEGQGGNAPARQMLGRLFTGRFTDAAVLCSTHLARPAGSGFIRQSFDTSFGKASAPHADLLSLQTKANGDLAVRSPLRRPQ